MKANQTGRLGLTLATLLVLTAVANTSFAADDVVVASGNPSSASSGDKTTNPASNADTTVATDSTLNIPPAIVRPDPYEKMNRAFFSLNDKLDTYLFKPIAQFYNTIMPKPLNVGIHNVFNNIGETSTIANDILQGHFRQMANDSWRLLINTTVGVGGLFDVASRMNLPYYSNDFGLTLAAWGYQSSNYLVIPLLGPATIRDSIGWPVDYYAFTVYPYIRPQSTQNYIYVLNMLDRRAQLLKIQSVMDEVALDKYVFVRDAYFQRRDYQISQNQQLNNGVANQALAAADNNQVVTTEAAAR